MKKSILILMLLSFIFSFSQLALSAEKESFVKTKDDLEDRLEAKKQKFARLEKRNAERMRRIERQMSRAAAAGTGNSAVPQAVNITMVSGTLNVSEDSWGDFKLLGEAKNTGSTAGPDPMITVDLYDADNLLLESSYAFIIGGSIVKDEGGFCFNALLPGETGFFEMVSWTDSSAVDHYTYTFSASGTYESVARVTLSFTTPPTVGADYWGDVLITGDVTNNSNYYLAYNAWVYFALKNSAGKVIDVVGGYVDGPDSNGQYNTIHPGASESFTLTTWNDYSLYSSYSYAFDYDEIQVRTPPTYTLSVQSSPGTGASITVSPDDKSGNGNGSTNFTRSYEADTTVTLKAPSTLNGNTFQKWIVDGTTNSSRTASVTMTKNITAVAAYIAGDASTIALNRTSLYFACVQGGAVPAPQTFIISNNGAGTLGWNIDENLGAVSCSPGSGTGDAIVTVTVDPTGYAAGTHTGTLDITCSTATNSPQQVNVYLNVIGAAGNQAPLGDFVTPAEGAEVSSSVPVTGWAVDDSGVAGVKIYVENGGGLQYIGDAVFVAGARDDIEAIYPNYPASYQAGWGYMLLTHFLPRGDDTYKLHAIATDSDGRATTLGGKTITVNNADAVKPFGAIDTPTQGGTASGSSFANVGWVLTPMPDSIPTNGSTISVWVDGVNLGHPTYNLYRSDIAGFFPGYANSDGAMARFILDTTIYKTGNHSVFWIASDSAGNSDGIGSRFFTIENAVSRSPGSAESEKADCRDDDFFARIPADTQSPVNVITGFNPLEKPRAVFSDGDGVSRLVIKENERVEIDFSGMMGNGGTISGRMVSHWLVKSLPTGSTLDKKSGKFSWVPGVGFMGDYKLVFLVESQAGAVRKDVQVTIVPKFSN